MSMCERCRDDAPEFVLRVPDADYDEWIAGAPICLACLLAFALHRVRRLPLDERVAVLRQKDVANLMADVWRD